jgi:hypothetical protein
MTFPSPNSALLVFQLIRMTLNCQIKVVYLTLFLTLQL